MIGTDRYSYASALKGVDPTAKLLLSAVSMALCLLLESVFVSLTAIAACCFLSASAGKTPSRVFLRLMRAPFVFLLIGTLTVFVGRFDAMGEVLIGVPIGGAVYGISAAALRQGVRLVCRAMGCVASVYFTVLSTPIPDLLPALKRLSVPQLFLSLTELIYRFIFLLYDAAARIRVAQESRLGYRGIRRSYHSFGTLLGMVFLKAYRKSDRVYTALESRGYTGEVRTLPPQYQSGRRVYLWCVALTACQAVAYLLERRGI